MLDFLPTLSATTAAKGEQAAAPNSREEVIHEFLFAQPLPSRTSPPIVEMNDGMIRMPLRAAVSNPNKIPPQLVTIVEYIKKGHCLKHSAALGDEPVFGHDPLGKSSVDLGFGLPLS